MTRVKGGVTSNRRRKNILVSTKGYRRGLSKKKRQAREALYHAQLHAFDHRRDKKGDFRSLWIGRINAALRQNGLSYSRFIKTLSDKGAGINRKMLATLAKDRPEVFARLVEKIK